MNEFKNISTGSLIQLYKVYQSLINSCSIYALEHVNDITKPYLENGEKLKAAQKQLAVIKEALIERKKEIKWSYEKIFQYAGQYDSYAMFEFYPGSEAHEKYGLEVHGRVAYHRQERMRLESIVSSSYYDNDGQVYIESGTDNLVAKATLKNEGFLASDVYNLYITTAPNKSFGQSGIKEVPNTHIIPISSKSFNISGAQMQVLGYYKNEGFKLPQHDQLLYYANHYLFRPEKITKLDIEQYLFEIDGETLTREARETIISLKVQEGIANESEMDEFKVNLSNRHLIRLDEIKKQLGVSKKVIDDLYSINPDNYLSIIGSTVMFEIETLEYLDKNAVIYWDFERFIHIFLRHNVNFFVEASTKKQGTHFQYTQKDITRIIKIVIRQEREKIITQLNRGEDYGGTGIYYNGNHYQLRINSSGLLLQFHPMD